MTTYFSFFFICVILNKNYWLLKWIFSMTAKQQQQQQQQKPSILINILLVFRIQSLENIVY